MVLTKPRFEEAQTVFALYRGYVEDDCEKRNRTVFSL